MSRKTSSSQSKNIYAGKEPEMIPDNRILTLSPANQGLLGLCEVVLALSMEMIVESRDTQLDVTEMKP